MIETVVRMASEDDLPGIVELWKEMIDFHGRLDPLFTRSQGGAGSFESFLRENMVKEGTALFVAEVEGRAVGYLLANECSYPPVFTRERYGMISDAAVTASCRRQGTGEALVNAAARWFRERGLSRMEMRLLNANPISTAFWRKMGFIPYMTTLFRELD